MKKNLNIALVTLSLGAGLLPAQSLPESTIKTVNISEKIEQPAYQSGRNIISLNAQDLEKYQGQNLTEVLSQISGFQITGNNNNPTEPKSLKIRGGRASNVVILLNGIPLKDATGNDYTMADLRLLPLDNIDSIEILNGASSVLYGSNASVSVIDIKTKNASKKIVEGKLNLRAGSFSTFNQNANIKGKIQNFHYEIFGLNEKSDGLSAAAGNDSFDNDGWEKQNITATVGYRRKDFQINLHTGWSHNLYLYDTGAFTDGYYRGNDQLFYLGGNTSLKYKNGQVTLNLRNTENKRLFQVLEKNNYQDDSSLHGHSLFAELYNTYKVNPSLEITTGIQYEKQSITSDVRPWGSPTLISVLQSKDAYNSSLEAFLNTHTQIQNFHLVAGGRLINHSKFKSHWIYSLNPYYLNDFRDTFFKIGYTYATAFIAPTLYQNHGSLPYVLPNDTLNPETNQSHGVDLNFGKKDGSLNLYTSLFIRTEKDGFAYTNGYPTQVQNIDHNEIKGLEFGFDYQPHMKVRLGGNFTYIEKQDTASRLRVPKQRANAYLSLTPLQGTKVNIFYTFIGKRTDATYTQKDIQLPDYSLWKLNISQIITKHINAYFNLDNALNKSYTDVIGYTPIPRTYTLGMNYLF